MLSNARIRPRPGRTHEALRNGKGSFRGGACRVADLSAPIPVPCPGRSGEASNTGTSLFQRAAGVVREGGRHAAEQRLPPTVRSVDLGVRMGVIHAGEMTWKRHDSRKIGRALLCTHYVYDDIRRGI